MIIELNGTIYTEVERGRFEATLLNGIGREVAHTEGNKVIMYRGNWDDVRTWADSYDIEEIEYRGEVEF